jgi:hypothetical protein
MADHALEVRSHCSMFTAALRSNTARCPSARSIFTYTVLSAQRSMAGLTALPPWIELSSPSNSPSTTLVKEANVLDEPGQGG